ncbi:hypothetical protein ACQZV8_18770, partial [Magnetococcales bacterium HHB-1]
MAVQEDLADNLNPFQDEGLLTPALEENLLEEINDLDGDKDVLTENSNGLFDELSLDLLAEDDQEDQQQEISSKEALKEQSFDDDLSSVLPSEIVDNDLFAEQDDVESSEPVEASYAFDPEEQVALFEGVEDMVVFINLFESFETTIELAGQNGLSLAGLREIIRSLDERLKSSTYDYYNDATDPPETYTSDDFIASVRSTDSIGSEQDDLTISYSYDSSSHIVQFDLELQAMRNGALRLDSAPSSLPDSKATSTQVALNIRFGLDLDQRDAFFIIVRQFSADISDESSSLSFKASPLSSDSDTPLTRSQIREIDNGTLSDYFSLNISVQSKDNSIIDTVVNDEIHLEENALFSLGDTLTIASDGILTGTGSIDSHVINNGIVSPGNSPGIQTYAAGYTQSGELIIEIGGLTAGPGNPNIDDGYDQVQVTGTATLNGQLTVTEINSFSPEVGQTFEIMTFDSISGDFSDFSGLWIGDGLYYDPIINASNYTLEVKELPWGDLDFSFASQAMADQFISLWVGKLSGSISVTVDVAVQNFVTLSGSLGVEKDSTDLKVAAQGVTALLGNTNFNAGVQNANLALTLTSGGLKTIFASGDFQISGGDFANASGTATVKYNDTGSTFSAQDLTVGSVTVSVEEMTDGLKAISGSSLSVDINDFVSLSGGLAFEKSGTDIKAVAENLSASLGNTNFSAGITSADLALVLSDGGKTVLYASGTFALTGGDFANASGTATIKWNNTGSTFSAQDVTIDSVTVS